MSKRPLNSLNWMPVAEAHRLLTGLLGNGYLAAKDLTDAVTAKRSDKRLPCMQRAIASRIAPDQDREIVPLLFRFDSEKLQVWEWRDDVPVVRVPADVAPVYLGPADAAPVFRPPGCTLTRQTPHFSSGARSSKKFGLS